MVEIRGSAATEPPAGWPRYEAGQVRVMLLGAVPTAGERFSTPDGDGVLSETRQAELRELARRLSRWNPERVAVELPYERADAVDEAFERYRSREYAYDSEEALDVGAGGHESACRSPAVQVGFRLADRLGHGRVYPVDPAESDGALDGTESGPTDEALHEAFRRANEEDHLRTVRGEAFERHLRDGADGDDGPRALAARYERDLRLARNLWRTVDEDDDERVLLVVGAERVPALRHLLDETPPFCPTSPLPYL